MNAQANNGNIVARPVGQTGVAHWNLGDVPMSTSMQARVTVRVAIRGKTSITNTANVGADSPDPVASNNTASITTKVGAGRGGR